ncbi:unnamed protein product [Gadus morhua 'NCC']
MASATSVRGEWIEQAETASVDQGPAAAEPSRPACPDPWVRALLEERSWPRKQRELGVMGRGGTEMDEGRSRQDHWGLLSPRGWSLLSPK